MPGWIVPKLTEKDYERDHHERFIETQFGYLDYHDYPGQKYYRNFQGEHDLDLIRRYIPYNLCSGYPDVTYRYFAQNWPELCIFAFTDTHIPIGVIMGHQIEPRRARITMFAVEHRVDHKVVYKRLFNLVLKRMRENEIKQVVILPLNEDKRRRMLQVIGSGGPLRFINSDKEFQFYI